MIGRRRATTEMRALAEEECRLESTAALIGAGGVAPAACRKDEADERSAIWRCVARQRRRRGRAVRRRCVRPLPEIRGRSRPGVRDDWKLAETRWRWGEGRRWPQIKPARRVRPSPEVRISGRALRVQRVAGRRDFQGRIHTSAAGSRVLPRRRRSDVQIDEQDLRIDVFRAIRAGGQHVNKTRERGPDHASCPPASWSAQQDEKRPAQGKRPKREDPCAPPLRGGARAPREGRADSAQEPGVTGRTVLRPVPHFYHSHLQFRRAGSRTIESTDPLPRSRSASTPRRWTR